MHGQSVMAWEDYGGSTNEMSKYDTYSSVFWLCDKSEKSSIDSSSRIIICGNDNKFQGNDFITAKTKNGKYK